MIIMGVDPGASGAIAFYWTEDPGVIAVQDVPTVNGEINGAELAKIMKTMKPDLAIVEQVGSMPGQGVSSTFKFGMAYGVVRGVIAAMNVPMHLVTPGKWKRHFNLDSDKEKARALAIRLWPSCQNFARKMDHGRAEAALIARYMAETQTARAA